MINTTATRLMCPNVFNTLSEESGLARVVGLSAQKLIVTQQAKIVSPMQQKQVKPIATNHKTMYKSIK